jgi:hypothetical protein
VIDSRKPETARKFDQSAQASVTFESRQREDRDRYPLEDRLNQFDLEDGDRSQDVSKSQRPATPGIQHAHEYF